MKLRSSWSGWSSYEHNNELSVSMENKEFLDDGERQSASQLYGVSQVTGSSPAQGYVCVTLFYDPSLKSCTRAH